MNFLFGSKSNAKSNEDSHSSVPISLPIALPADSALLPIDPSLLRSAKEPRLSQINLQSLSTNAVFKKIYASSLEESTMISTGHLLKNQFLAAANVAFDSHLGFVLNPSQLFLLLTQQVALHVNQHAEELRAQFVSHDGKKELSMEIPATPTKEEWEEIIGTFQAQIGANTVPDTRELLSLEGFESATLSEKIAGEVCLMDLCQQFFEYKMYTRCGIPYFILEGTVSDWELLRQKTEEVITRKTLSSLRDFWLPAILPVLDKLVRAKKSEELDRTFFENFYKRGAKGGSGGYTFVNGWINVFFPLTNEKERNKFCLPYDSRTTLESSPRDGLDVQDFTTGIASAPVLWTRMGEKIPMRFCAGFVGGKVIHENCVRPEVAWWVGPIDENATAKKMTIEY